LESVEKLYQSIPILEVMKQRLEVLKTHGKKLQTFKEDFISVSAKNI
jgi:hypothetical protein